MRDVSGRGTLHLTRSMELSDVGSFRNDSSWPSPYRRNQHRGAPPRSINEAWIKPITISRTRVGRTVSGTDEEAGIHNEHARV